MQLRNLKFFLLPILLIFLFSCGGGGGGSSYTVSGQFVSSYVKGIKVCAGSTCTYTDDKGKFYFRNLELPAKLNFYIGDVLIGNYTSKQNGEIVNPFKIAGNPNIGDKIAKIIHALVGDLNGTQEFIDLSGISVSLNSTVNSLVDAIENSENFTFNVNNGSYLVEFNGTEVNFCKNGDCKPSDSPLWLCETAVNPLLYPRLKPLEVRSTTDAPISCSAKVLFE
jgi:hypothetical protein